MFQLVTFIILLNEIFLYSSAPLTSMAAPQPLAGGKDEMNSSLIRNNNNKNTHKAPSAFYFSFPFRGGGVPSPLPWAMKPGLGLLLAQLRWMDGGSPVPPQPLLLLVLKWAELQAWAGSLLRAAHWEGRLGTRSPRGLTELPHRAVSSEQALVPRSAKLGTCSLLSVALSLAAGAQALAVGTFRWK